MTRILQLADFEGPWSLVRSIAHTRGGPDGRFEGQAVFSREAGVLAYREDGLLTLDGQTPVVASRRYHWTARQDGRIAVTFPDGRPFHDFPLSGSAEAEHWCAPDLYRVTYDFSAWPDWTAVWRVNGPRKDYSLVSRYGPAD